MRKKYLFDIKNLSIFSDIYLKENCRMLKDFKFYSHVLCAKNTIKNITNDAIVIARLDIDPGSDDEEDKVRVKRDYRRHYAPSHLDMRDILSPDIYHRYDLIVNYLQVLVSFNQYPPS